MLQNDVCVGCRVEKRLNVCIVGKRLGAVPYEKQDRFIVLQIETLTSGLLPLLACNRAKVKEPLLRRNGCLRCESIVANDAMVRNQFISIVISDSKTFIDVV